MITPLLAQVKQATGEGREKEGERRGERSGEKRERRGERREVNIDRVDFDYACLLRLLEQRYERSEVRGVR